MHSPSWASPWRRLPALAVIGLSLSTAFTGWLIAGFSGLTYMLLFAVLCVPGLPLGFALFGRDHVAGWLAGLLFGYAVTSFAWWVVIFFGQPSTFGFASSWGLSVFALWAITRP